MISNRGSALITSTAIALMLGTVLVALQKGVFQSILSGRRNSAESELMATAHSVTALIKQDLLSNYTNFTSTSSWAPCRGTGTISNFLSVLQNPLDTSAGNPNIAPDPTLCSQVIFNWGYFVRNDNLGYGVKLSDFRNTVIRLPQTINGFRISARFLELQISGAQARAVGEITLSFDKPKMLDQSIRFSIDGPTLINSASTPQSLCRGVAGALCDDIDLMYLEVGSGRLMRATYSSVAKRVAILPVSPAQTFPTSISLKWNGGSVKSYKEGGIAVPGISGTLPVRYIIDTAKDTTTGIDYFLTIHGKIITGSNVVIATDPKVVSISHFNGAWYLLRSDGAVCRTKTLNDPATYLPIPGMLLPTALTISSGT